MCSRKKDVEMKGKKGMLVIIVSVVILILAGFFVWSIIGSRGERPKYQVVLTKGDIQIRDYAPMIVAEVETTGKREDAISQGFKILAGYIFGGNKSSSKIAMTAPVSQKRVNKKWEVQFMMPSDYSLSALPQPNNAAIKFRQVDSKRYVVIGFSGIATEKVLENKLNALQDFLQTEKITPISDPIYAFFNPPWTLPPMRHTEIMIEVK